MLAPLAASLTRSGGLAQSLMKKYDVNESGDLDRSQLKQLMTDYNNKVEPNEEEVSFVLKMADARSTGSVSDENEIKEAVSAWKGLQRDMDLINARYEHYDNNQSGKLEKGQLKVLLQDLNEGIPPTKAEVEWVLAAADKSESGGVDHDELRAAIAIWYTRTGAAADTTAAPTGVGPAPVKQSGLCAIL